MYDNFYGVYLVVVASGGSFSIRSSFKNKYSNMLWADKTWIMGWIGSNHFVCVLLNALLIRVDLSLIRLFELWLNPVVSVTTRIIICTGFLELLTSTWWLTGLSRYVCLFLLQSAQYLNRMENKSTPCLVMTSVSNLFQPKASSGFWIAHDHLSLLFQLMMQLRGSTLPLTVSAGTNKYIYCARIRNSLNLFCFLLLTLASRFDPA